MTVRFLADEDVAAALVEGLRAREPRLDILDAKTAGLRGTEDGRLLEIAFELGRVLISCDRQTMTKHFYDRQKTGRTSAGLCIVPQRGPLGPIIDALLLIWGAATPEELRDIVMYLP